MQRENQSTYNNSKSKRVLKNKKEVGKKLNFQVLRFQLLNYMIYYPKYLYKF